jgi:hypothetical protein
MLTYADVCWLRQVLRQVLIHLCHNALRLCFILTYADVC